MKMTQREFRIAATAALFGFFLCYFLFGADTPARSPQPKMTVIGPAPTNQAPIQFWIQGAHTNAQRLPQAPTGFGYPVGPLWPSRPNVDLFSSRYKVDVDLSDLQHPRR